MTPPGPHKTWLTTTEAGALLHKDRTTLWHWIQRQIIPKQYLLRVGSHTYIARAWVVGGAA